MIKMNSGRVIRRVVIWNFRKTAKTLIILAVCTFLLLYGYARWTGDLQELFEVYLGGFQRSALLALLWLLVHLPVEGFLYSNLMDMVNKSFYTKILKYKSKERYLHASLWTLAPQILTYYITGYGLLLILVGRVDMKLIFWQVGLAGLESLNIILAALLISMIDVRWENIAFPAVVIIELVNCILCGKANGIFRFLPFTQGKLLLQKEYFDNGVALVTSLIILCIVLICTAMIWVRKDERSE